MTSRPSTPLRRAEERLVRTAMARYMELRASHSEEILFKAAKSPRAEAMVKACISLARLRAKR